jgi:hypothetical protein
MRRLGPGPYIIAAGISRTVRLTTFAVPTAARPTAVTVLTVAAVMAWAACMAMQPESAAAATVHNPPAVSSRTTAHRDSGILTVISLFVSVRTA